MTTLFSRATGDKDVSELLCVTDVSELLCVIYRYPVLDNLWIKWIRIVWVGIEEWLWLQLKVSAFLAFEMTAQILFTKWLQQLVLVKLKKACEIFQTSIEMEGSGWVATNVDDRRYRLRPFEHSGDEQRSSGTQISDDPGLTVIWVCLTHYYCFLPVSNIIRNVDVGFSPIPDS